MSRLSYTQNRELSWLKFNERVLEEAEDPSVPLLERLKFVSIFTDNLDEFFMIRVGSLFDLSMIDGKRRDDKSNLTPEEQLTAIYREVRILYHKKTKVYNEIKESLKQFGVHPLDYQELEKNEVKYIKEYYKTSVEPILSPQIVDTHHPFPHIANKTLCIVSMLKHKGKNTLGILPVPASLPEVIFLPGNDVRYIRTEKILFEFVESVFVNYELIEKNILCITRNADISPDDEAFEASEDFRSKMKKMLSKRKRLSIVRLEANYPLSEKTLVTICDKFEIHESQIFVSDTALKMNYIFELFNRVNSRQRTQLTYPVFNPATPAGIDLNQSVIKQCKRQDILLFYPYESMRTFLQLIKEASCDSSVISIKITIYRLSKKTKLVDYLCTAAENGKDVTVLLELRARFDEQNNIDWSEKLEESGCKIIYGFDAYKVHSKVCLITMKEGNQVSYITQVGTGNYNEKTAELYTDISLITANPAIGQDAMDFFKNISIGYFEGNYSELLIAPVGFKRQLLTMMDEEIIKGAAGNIFIKINSLTDIDFIEKLALASRSGVKIQLIIRGICCLLPGVRGETDNITVISIVGRFLEHSRIYCFGSGQNQKIYIASADLMTRNTERRIEVACPIIDKKNKDQISKMLETLWSDNIKSRILQMDGSYIKKYLNGSGIDCQNIFIDVHRLRPGSTKNNKFQLMQNVPRFIREILKPTS